jgi:hypothetical protein
MAWPMLTSWAQSPGSLSRPPALDAKTRAEVVEKIGELLVKFYIFPDKAKDMQALLAKKLQGGQYDKLEDVQALASTLTTDLRSVSHDRHIRVNYNPEAVQRIRARESQSPADREKERQRALEAERQWNFGFEKLEILDGNIGYLDLRAFSGSREAGETAVAAMNFLANAGAVIIDLRRNGGGDPAMIQLISSYFLKDSTHLNSFENRGEDTLQQFWSLPFVPGKSMADTDLYILTSARTFSAAEEFTYNMKNLKRATIVGETTGGGAHPGGSRIVNDGFLVWIPTGRAVNPITKTNWEGTGIAPDVPVAQDKALDKARAMALEKLAQKTPDEQARARLTWALKSLKAKTEPVAVDEAVLKKYLGRYGPGEIILENGQLLTVIDGRKFKMIAVSPTYFVVAGDVETQVEFVPGKDGGEFEVIVHNPDGGTQRLGRTKDTK